VVAIVTGLGEPKNVDVTSIRNTPVRDSIIHVERKATAKEGTNNFPAEDFSFVLRTSQFYPQKFPNDTGKLSAVNRLC